MFTIFKYVKSKKGFTLVELMIVVVIMAILVAVAVPIFSAVTKNARVKTCAGNRREIVSQLNNYIMGSVDGQQHTDDARFTITSNGDTGNIGEASGISSDVIAKLFQELPYCPAGTAEDIVTYEVVITKSAGAEAGADYAKVEITCDADEGHA